MNNNDMRYEVWAFGYDKEDMCTDVEEFLGKFDTPEKAIAYAKKFTDLYSKEERDYLEDGDYLCIIVETIKNTDPTNMNIETIYENYIY